jgi:hypothetical protein
MINHIDEKTQYLTRFTQLWAMSTMDGFFITLYVIVSGLRTTFTNIHHALFPFI